MWTPYVAATGRSVGRERSGEIGGGEDAPTSGGAMSASSSAVGHADDAHRGAAGADMICVGSRGRSGLTRMLFGSVSQELLLRSERPVLLVQSPAAARAKPSAGG